VETTIQASYLNTKRYLAFSGLVVNPIEIAHEFIMRQDVLELGMGVVLAYH
jgi:hypothetical protein